MQRCSLGIGGRPPGGEDPGQATTGGGISSTFGYPENSTFTYPLWLYVVGFRYGALGYANVLAVVLFVVAIMVTAILLRRFRTFLGSEQ